MSTVNQTEQVVALPVDEQAEKTKEEILAELQAHVSSFRNRLEDIFTNNDLKDQRDQEIAEELKHVFRAQLNDALLYLIAEDKTSWRGTLAQLLDSQISGFRSKQQRSEEAVMILDSNLTGITDIQYLIQRLLGDGLLFQLELNDELAQLLTTVGLTPEKLAVAPAYINHYAGPKIQTETEQYEFHSRQIVVLREVCSVIEQYQSTYESIMAAPLISKEERMAFLFALLVPGEQIGTNYPQVWLYKYWPEEFFQYYNANPWLKEKATELFPDRAREFVPRVEQRLSKRDHALFALLQNFQYLEDIEVVDDKEPSGQPYRTTVKWINQTRDGKTLSTKELVDAVLDGKNQPLDLDPNPNNYEPFLLTLTPIVTSEEQVVLDADPSARREHEQKNPTYNIELRLYTFQSDTKPDQEGILLLTHGSLKNMDKLCAFLIDSIDYPISIEEGGSANDRFQHLNRSRLLARQQGLLN